MPRCTSDQVMVVNGIFKYGIITPIQTNNLDIHGQFIKHCHSNINLLTKIS